MRHMMPPRFSNSNELMVFCIYGVRNKAGRGGDAAAQYETAAKPPRNRPKAAIFQCMLAVQMHCLGRDINDIRPSAR